MRGLDVGVSVAESGGWDRVVGSTVALGLGFEDDVVEGLSVEEVDSVEDCAPREGVIVTLLLRLGLWRNMFSGRRVAASLPSCVATPSRRS